MQILAQFLGSPVSHNFHDRELHLQARTVPACSQGHGLAHHWHICWLSQTLQISPNTVWDTFRGICIIWCSLLDKLTPFPVPKKTFLFYWPCYLEETESTFQMPIPIYSTILLCLLQSRCKRNLIDWEQRTWMSQNPGTATSFSKEKHASLWEMRAFSNVGMNASPLNLKDERCNLNSQTGETTSGTSTSKHCRQICSPQQPRALHPPPPLSGRDPRTGHSNWEGFVGDPGVMPITPRTNVHSDFTSFRNKILHFFSKKNLLFAWKRWNRMKPTPNSFTLWYAQPKEGNRQQPFPTNSPTAVTHLWRPGIYPVYLKNCYDQLLLFYYIYLC